MTESVETTRSKPLTGRGDTGRLAHIDGLRGLAIAMVVLFHVWLQRTDAVYHHDGARHNLFDTIASRGDQGVTLFFVLSGFCLSLPLWSRLHAGRDDWFQPSVFFARRCLRILPPYYAALVLSLVFSGLWSAFGHRPLTFVSSFPDPLNIISHVLLVHNMTPFATTVNGPFWSLAVEWQWYFVFPFVFLLCLRLPRLSTFVCIGVACFWGLVVYTLRQPHLPLPFHLNTLAWAWHSEVPAYVVEFCLGILVARQLSARVLPPAPLLLFAAVLSLAAAKYIGPGTALGYAPYDSLLGVGFGSLVLLTEASARAKRFFSRPLLVRLGIVSYSVYLVHAPLVNWIWAASPLWLARSYLLLPLAAAASVLLGSIFHAAVERPCMRRSTWDRVGPRLIPFFAWTDRAWARVSRLESETPPQGILAAQVAEAAQ